MPGASLLTAKVGVNGTLMWETSLECNATFMSSGVTSSLLARRSAMRNTCCIFSRLNRVFPQFAEGIMVSIEASAPDP